MCCTQIQGENGGAIKYRGLVRGVMTIGEDVECIQYAPSIPYQDYINLCVCVCVIVEQEGAQALLKGMTASMMREASYSSIRMGAYEPIKKLIVTEGEGIKQ